MLEHVIAREGEINPSTAVGKRPHSQDSHGRLLVGSSAASPSASPGLGVFSLHPKVLSKLIYLTFVISGNLK